MNKTKRNLILASAIINLIAITYNLVVAIIYAVNKELLQTFIEYDMFTMTYNLVYNAIFFAAGLVGSILLIYSVREKGKYFRNSYKFFLAGFIIIVVCGGFLAWVLLFISMFVSDVIVINSPREVRQEEKSEYNSAYEEKKLKIEELKKLRDEGAITEEEYKQRLFEIL